MMATVNSESPAIESASQSEQLDLSARRVKLHLAQNVTLARRRAGLTQLQLARAAELSRATVHLIEAGICDARLSTVARLAKALGLDALDLLTQESPSTQTPTPIDRTLSA